MGPCFIPAVFPVWGPSGAPVSSPVWGSFVAFYSLWQHSDTSSFLTRGVLIMILDPLYVNHLFVCFLISADCFLLWLQWFGGFPNGSMGKKSACNAGDAGSIPVSGRPPGEGSSNPLWCSCLETSMDRGAWWATVHEVAKNRKQLSMHAHTHTHILSALT